MSKKETRKLLKEILADLHQVRHELPWMLTADQTLRKAIVKLEVVYELIKIIR